MVLTEAQVCDSLGSESNESNPLAAGRDSWRNTCRTTTGGLPLVGGDSGLSDPHSGRLCERLRAALETYSPRPPLVLAGRPRGASAVGSIGAALPRRRGSGPGSHCLWIPSAPCCRRTRRDWIEMPPAVDMPSARFRPGAAELRLDFAVVQRGSRECTGAASPVRALARSRTGSRQARQDRHELTSRRGLLTVPGPRRPPRRRASRQREQTRRAGTAGRSRPLRPPGRSARRGWARERNSLCRSACSQAAQHREEARLSAIEELKATKRLR